MNWSVTPRPQAGSRCKRDRDGHLRPEQLKSYDYVNAKTYILTQVITISLRLKRTRSGQQHPLCQGKERGRRYDRGWRHCFVEIYTPANGTVDTTTYKLDTTTGVEITNQLDHANGGLQYLSRSDWTGTADR